MITIAHTIKINSPLEKVFAYTTSRADLAHWLAGVVKAQQDEPNGPGARAIITARLLGFTWTFVSEIVTYELNRTFAIKSDRPFSLQEQETFTRLDDNVTQIDYRGVFHTTGFFRMIDPLLSWLFKRQLTMSFHKLKDVLEANGEADKQELFASSRTTPQV